MYPVMFEAGPVTLYSYGLMIAAGILAGMYYLIIVGKKELGITFDQANMLFLAVFLAAVVGGKVFLFFEDPAYYSEQPSRLLDGRGFVFYGSFLFAVPVMWWCFRMWKLPILRMLDIMAVTTCLVHMFGRLGCFLAGCCYGVPTDLWFGVTYTDPECYAEPLNTPLVPTQLLESLYIFLVMCFLLWLRSRRTFYGQLFLTYLLCYAVGRGVLEIFRGDISRGYVFDGMLSHSQLIAMGITTVVILLYLRWKREVVQSPNSSTYASTPHPNAVASVDRSIPNKQSPNA